MRIGASLRGPYFFARDFFRIAGAALLRFVMAFWPQNSHGKNPAIDELRARYAALFARFGEAAAGIGFTPGKLGAIPGEWVRSGAPQAREQVQWTVRPDRQAGQIGPVDRFEGRTPGAQAEGNDNGRAILYFHGGGYVAGSPESHRPLIARLVESTGIPAFSVRYRLAPECFFPAAVRDGIDAYRALLAQGASGSSIIVAGDEAGGGLAFAVTLAVRNAGLEMPACVIARSPWADLSLSGLSVLNNRKSDAVQDWETLFLCARHYLRKSNPCDAYASPAYASFASFPPVMVHAGAHEILRDDASKLGDRAADANIAVSVEIYENMGHLFQMDLSRDEAKVSLARLTQFIRAKTAGASSAYREAAKASA